MTIFSLAHQAWRCLPANERRRILYGAASLVAPRAARSPLEPDGTPIVAGEMMRQSGLGQGARIMARALEAASVPVETLDVGTVTEPVRLDQQLATSINPSAPLILHVNSPQLPLALMRMGRRFVGKRMIIGYWAWELPTVPPLWKTGLRHVHEIWTPSNFSARALEQIAPGRVKVVPHAIAASPSAASSMDRAAFGLPGKAIIVLVSFSLASSFVRKNPLAAIKAFRSAFGDRPDRVLVLKFTEGTHYPQDEQILRQAVAGAQNIRLETRNFSEADAHALTMACDIVLSLHRSEGFGLVPAEAMNLGKAVIATNWSATSEFLDADCGFPVDYDLVPAQDPRGVFEAPGAVWAEARHDAAVRALVTAADNAGLRARLGAAASERAGTHFGSDALLRALNGPQA